MVEFPRIETERLILREFELSDANEVQRLVGDWAVAETLIGMPHPYGDGIAEVWIESLKKDYAVGEIVNFAVCEKESGALVGSLGLKEIKEEHQRAELGYWIGKEFWNRGYCTEAGQAAIKYGFEVLGLNRIFAHFLVWNPSSGRVMSKLGMKPEGVLRQHIAGRDGAFEDFSIYGILKKEWAG